MQQKPLSPAEWHQKIVCTLQEAIEEAWVGDFVRMLQLVEDVDKLWENPPDSAQFGLLTGLGSILTYLWLMLKLTAAFLISAWRMLASIDHPAVLLAQWGLWVTAAWMLFEILSNG